MGFGSLVLCSMRHGSLFSGAGGFDLAAEWMGWENVFHCEWNPFCQRVLKYYWPNAISYADITKTDFTIHRGGIDVLTGGFPCQPFSVAGKQQGTEDERYLWPEMLRAIREIAPRYIVGENVRGLVSWNGGMVFEQVCADLEALSYEVWPVILPAAGVNAPHKRERVWFIATNSKSGRLERQREFRKTKGIEREKQSICFDEGTGGNISTNTNSIGQTKRCKQFEPDRKGQFGGIGDKNDWTNWPTQPPLHIRDDGISSKLLRFVVNDMRYEISKTSEENRIKNLQEVWERVQQEEVWEKIRGLYSLESKDLLFQTMQLYSTDTNEQITLSPFSEEVSKNPLRILQHHGEFRSSPQGQKLEKQRSEQFGNSLSFLPHEVALAARAYTRSIRKFEAWHRKESIKAAGNAVVPQLPFQIFRAISDHGASFVT